MLQNILGQPYAVGVLQNAIRDGHLSGSYLFVGPDGVGKATTARQFAKLLCGITSDADPRARAIDAGTDPDVRTVAPQGPSGILRVSQLWPREGDAENRAENAMLRDLHFEPIAGPKRVFLIQDAEGLNGTSGNSLLKTLEEPPPYAHFLLTASSTASVLPTIVSRCQSVHFGLLPAGEVERALIDRFDVAPAPAHFLAAYCEGRLGRAVALSRSPALLAGREALLDLAHDLVTAPPIKSFKLGEEFRKLAPKMKASADDGAAEAPTGREPLLRGLDVLAAYYRDMLATRLMGRDHASLVNIDRAAEIAKAAAHYSPEQLEDAIALILAIKQTIERNANAQLALEVLFTRLTTLAEPVPA